MANDSPGMPMQSRAHSLNHLLYFAFTSVLSFPEPGTSQLRKQNKIYTQFSSVTQSHPTLCDPMNRSTPGLPVHHQLLEFTQTHVHRVSDAIQPSHPLLSPSPPAPNPSQHQSHTALLKYFKAYGNKTTNILFKDSF